MERAVVLPLRGIDLAVEPPFRIGAASVEPSSREARFGGSCERLQPQHLKVLIALARRKGEVVTRDELVAFCWDGRFVGEDVINRSVLILRRFAKRAGGFAIETVPRAGYRLVETGAAESPRRRGWLAAAGAIAVVAAVAAWLMFAPAPRQGQPPTPSIALLPIEPETPDAATRELAENTRDFLSHTLSDTGFPVKLVAAVPQSGAPVADFIVSGVAHRGADGVGVLVRIEDGEDRVVIFSNRFAAGGQETGLLPERVGAQVAAALSWSGALMILDRRYPSEPAVTGELLRQATLIIGGGDLLRAYEIGREVAPRAPNSAMAQLSLAVNTGFALDQLPRGERAQAVAVARRAAERARLLAPEFGDVHFTWCILNSPVRLAECEDRLREGLRVDPEAPTVDGFLSSLLEEVGRNEEALELAHLSRARNPYMPAKIARLVGRLEAAGHGAEAERLYLQGLRWWPDYPRLHWRRIMGLAARGDFDGLQRLGGQYGVSLPADYAPAADLVPVLQAGDLTMLRGACAGESEPSAKMLFCMIGLARLGDRDRAFELADALYPRMRGRTAAEEERLWLDQPRGGADMMLSAPSLAPLRRDARFIALADRVGLLAYWRSGRLPDFCRRSPEPVCRHIGP